MAPEFFVKYMWLISLLIIIPVCALFVMMCQAFFHDRKVALTGLITLILLAISNLFSVYFLTVLTAVFAVISLVFIAIFSVMYIRKPFVYIPLALTAVCGLALGGLYLAAV